MYAKLLKQSDINNYIVNCSTLSLDVQTCHNSHQTVITKKGGGGGGKPKAREIQHVRCSARRE